MISDPDKQCRGKVRFTDRAEAKAHMRRFPRKNTMQAYRCPHCGWWHIGHKIRKDEA